MLDVPNVLVVDLRAKFQKLEELDDLDGEYSYCTSEAAAADVLTTLNFDAIACLVSTYGNENQLRKMLKRSQCSLPLYTCATQFGKVDEQQDKRLVRTPRELVSLLNVDFTISSPALVS
jgi:hypothetical protein